jgi:hypothetical protein
MNRRLLALVAFLTTAAFVSPASAKTEAKAVTTLRCAPTYAAALAEAKDRGCVVFATFHADG